MAGGGASVRCAGSRRDVGRPATAMTPADPAERTAYVRGEGRRLALARNRRGRPGTRRVARSSPRCDSLRRLHRRVVADHRAPSADDACVVRVPAARASATDVRWHPDWAHHAGDGAGVARRLARVGPGAELGGQGLPSPRPGDGRGRPRPVHRTHTLHGTRRRYRRGTRDAFRDRRAGRRHCRSRSGTRPRC